MNYDANTIDWKPGDLVVHDADAKNPDMLIRIVGRTGESRYACEYLNREKREGFIGGIFTNGRESLHDPARFGIDVSKCFPALHAEIAKLKLRIAALEQPPAVLPAPMKAVATENMACGCLVMVHYRGHLWCSPAPEFRFASGILCRDIARNGWLSYSPDGNTTDIMVKGEFNIGNRAGIANLLYHYKGDLEIPIKDLEEAFPL